MIRRGCGGSLGSDSRSFKKPKAGGWLSEAAERGTEFYLTTRRFIGAAGVP